MSKNGYGPKGSRRKRTHSKGTERIQPDRTHSKNGHAQLTHVEFVTELKEGELPNQFFGTRYRAEDASNLRLPPTFFGRRDAVMMDFHDAAEAAPVGHVVEVSDVGTMTRRAEKVVIARPKWMNLGSEAVPSPPRERKGTAKPAAPSYLRNFQPYDAKEGFDAAAAQLSDDEDESRAESGSSDAASLAVPSVVFKSVAPQALSKNGQTRSTAFSGRVRRLLVNHRKQGKDDLHSP